MNMHGRDCFRCDELYWMQKLADYLHDPPDKALRIQGHKERSSKILAMFGELGYPDSIELKKADVDAAGMDRSFLPGYERLEELSGAIDFIENPVLTHPTGDVPPLAISISGAIDLNVACDDICDLIMTDMGSKPGDGGLSDSFRGDPARFAAARFFYVHHVLRNRLVEENIAGFGAVWHRMPADTRIPDHTIWQHNALVSALSSCYRESRNKTASIVVFSITPVQDFIARARKLRDFWTGSLILSWMAFEGIRSVMEYFGPDHVLYPSIVGQPLVDDYLRKEWNLRWLKEPRERSIATFPNKFLFLVPTGQEDDAARMVGEAIAVAWKDLSERVLRLILQYTGKEDHLLKTIFDRQTRSFWDVRWASCRLLHGHDFDAQDKMDTIRALLHESVWGRQRDMLVDAIDKELEFATWDGIFYSASHALAQSCLATGKLHQGDSSFDEPGNKCRLHGDLEILHYSPENQPDPNPPASHDPFWQTLKEKWGSKSDFKEAERLSSIAIIKRIAYRLEGHPLGDCLRNATLPSTTEVALSDWLDRVGDNCSDLTKKLDRNWRKVLSQYVHETDTESGKSEREAEIEDITADQRSVCAQVLKFMEERNDPIAEADKYYAILVMDGDRMGELIGGTTIEATWDSVIHPRLAEKIRSQLFKENYREFWSRWFSTRRMLSPAIHSAISEALGEFSLYTVPRVIERHSGRLIYAGGDDVCAVMPVSTVLQAAREIARWYNEGFVLVSDEADAGILPISNSIEPSGKRLFVHLGKGEKISISGAILITHHKRPLRAAMMQAHDLLESSAKEMAGRNAVAIALDKRSGGTRTFVARWKECPLKIFGGFPGAASSSLLDIFLKIGQAMAIRGNRSLSTSFVYRLEQMRPGIEALVAREPGALPRFIEAMLKSSSVKSDLRELPQMIASLIARVDMEDGKSVWVDTKSLIVARFIGQQIARRYRGDIKEENNATSEAMA